MVEDGLPGLEPKLFGDAESGFPVGSLKRENRLAVRLEFIRLSSVDIWLKEVERVN